jgi:hypothetical protein
MKLPKIKVYFWHLVIMFIAILGAFYYIYKDMKRMETNMLGLFMRCNTFDKLLGTKPTAPTPAPAPEIEAESVKGPVIEESIESTESLPDLIPVEIPVEISEVKDVVDKYDDEFIDSDDSDDDIVDTVLNDESAPAPSPSPSPSPAPAQESAPYDKSALLRMTNTELKEILKNRGVVISGTMNKNKLVSLILGESE